MALKPVTIKLAVTIDGMESEKVRVQREHCDPATIAATLAGPEVGAIVTFTGTVKEVTKQGTVERIEFSADEPVALAQMEALRVEACERFAIHDAALVHRVGMLEAGELIVVCCAAAVHRGDAFRACEWLINTLKQRVPIWKREQAPDGTRWVTPQHEVKHGADG
jgi:molybdopterin synthase catalytic subunit|tara:strand:+ start:117 stop:611 length:495 start_codon:yes stop_codon:yes gene_type:complete